MGLIIFPHFKGIYHHHQPFSPYDLKGVSPFTTQKNPIGAQPRGLSLGGLKNHLHLDLLGSELDQKLAGSPMAKNFEGWGLGNKEFIKLNYRLL